MTGRVTRGMTTLLSGALLAMLAACDAAPPAPAPQPSETPTDGEPRSIFRPEFQETEKVEEALSPLETRIQFGNDAELSEAAMAELATVARSPQMARGGTVILRGHSDAGGSDEVNLRASRTRAEAVRDWLVENGVAEDRITIIAFGEQNPIAPNALPNGEANESGRALNRRVDLTVAVDIPQPAATPQPSLAETLSNPEDAAETAR